MNEDIQLLRLYAAGSERAFETVVTRYIGLVYSAALRQVREPGLAEEITQAVFLILARKAGSLGPGTILPGWLCRTARYTAANAIRREHSRRQREQEAYMQSTLGDETSRIAWQEIWPLIDDAMARLGRTDRDALVLRFFENKTLKEVGAALGLEERAAQKRVNRSLEKLRSIFQKRGFGLTAAGLAATISANSVQAAPAGLTPAVLALNQAPTTVPGALLGLVNSTWRRLFWQPWIYAASAGLTAVLLAGLGAVSWEHHQSSIRYVHAGVSRIVIPVMPGARMAPDPNAAADGMTLDLQGTDGLAFELIRTENGVSETEHGVLPSRFSFPDGDYTLTINLRGTGDFHLKLLRDQQPMATTSASIQHPVRFTITGKKGRQGISFSRSRI